MVPARAGWSLRGFPDLLCLDLALFFKDGAYAPAREPADVSFLEGPEKRAESMREGRIQMESATFLLKGLLPLARLLESAGPIA